MLTSKEVLDQSGLSRATLNNYIGWGLVPRPQVLPPGPSDGSARRIGYFPDDVIARIGEIQRLKREGLSIQQIAQRFAGGTQVAAAAKPVLVTPVSRQPADVPAAQPVQQPARTPALPLDEIEYPAWVVNAKSEVVWANAAAKVQVSPAMDAGQPNVLKVLLEDGGRDAPEGDPAIRLHVALSRQQGATLEDVCRDLAPWHEAAIARLYEERAAFDYPRIVRVQSTSSARQERSHYLYALTFLRATLFIEGPADSSEALAAIAAADASPAIADAPEMVEVAVVSGSLHEAGALWAELPAEEYFELVQAIHAGAEPIVKRHHGVLGPHVGEGVACYFFARGSTNHLWNAVVAAHELRVLMLGISRAWQLRKGWARNLHLGIGVDEGREWSRPGVSPETTNVRGDAVDRAHRMSDLASDGSLWVTKNLVAKLPAIFRARLKFGVRRRTAEGDSVLVASTFGSMPAVSVPVAEVIDIVGGEGPSSRPAGLASA